MSKPLLTGILLILGLHPGIWAQASVTAELSGTRIVIGDQVNLQIRVSRTGNAQVDIDLQPLAETEGLEIIKESDPVRKEDPGMSYLEKNVTITSFDSGEYVVPPLTVRLLDDGGQVQELRTNPIPLEVLTIPIVSDTLQLAPIKGIEEEPFTFRDGLPYLLGAAGLGLIVFLLWWFYFRKQPEDRKNIAVIRRPPHEVALAKLDALEKQQLWQQGHIKEYYSELTYIAREYLENRFKIPALENTTGEILQKLKDFPEIDEPLANQLRRILTSSDMVKFAKAEPAASFHQEALSATRTFVDSTRQEEAEPVPLALATMEISREAGPEDEVFGPVQAGAAAGLLSTGDEVIISGAKPMVEAAGFWPRFFARLIDVVLSSGIVLLAVSFGAYITREISGGAPPAGVPVVDIILVGLWLWTYYALIPYRLGGTVGKQFLQIRTVDLEGKPISLGRANLRFVGKIFTEALLGLGYLTYFFTKERKSLPDLLAGTKVIKKIAYRPAPGADAGRVRPLALAGFWPRFFARLLDFVFLGLCIGLFLVAELLLLSALDVGNGPDWMAAMAVGLYVIMIWAYFVVTTVRFGATPGKLLLKIQVVDKQDQKVDLKTASLRFVGIIMSEMFSGLGYLTYFVDKNNRQSLPDIFANTRVVKKRAQTREVLLDRLDD